MHLNALSRSQANATRMQAMLPVSSRFVMGRCAAGGGQAHGAGDSAAAGSEAGFAAATADLARGLAALRVAAGSNSSPGLTLLLDTAFEAQVWLSACGCLRVCARMWFEPRRVF